jgi:hypothetical protein
MPIDPKLAKKNAAQIKTALQKVSGKKKDGKPVRVFFAFAPGKDAKDHILKVDVRKKGQALVSEILKTNKERKQICFGMASADKADGKLVMYISYVKKLSGGERKMQEALKAMMLPYAVKLESEDEISDADVATLDEDEEEDTSDDDADDADTPQQAQADDDDDSAAAGEQAQADDDGDSAAAEEQADDEDADADDEDADADDEDADADDEDADAEEQPAAAASAPAAKSATPAAAAKLKALGAAPQVWTQTRSVMSKSIDQLTAAIRKEYSSEHPDVLADIEKGMAKMSEVTARFDHRLAEAMDKAHKAKDEAARKAQLASAKAILTEHIKYVQSEPMIAHIDSNPFGVQTNLKKLLTASLTHMAKVIG